MTLILISFLAWVLASPFLLIVDTRENLYIVRWLGFVQASLVPVQDDLLCRIRLLFWQRDFSLIRLFATQKKQPHKTTQKSTLSRPKKSKWRFTITRLRRLLNTFRVRYFHWELDTDDFVANAYLYPLCRVLNTPTRYVAINFEGRNHCAFRIENRVIAVLIALFF